MSSLKILMLNQDWFAKEFKELGHEVMTCGIRNHLDYELLPFEHIHEIFKKLSWNADEPDLIIIHDESAPWYFVGLEAVDIPIIFYSVDIHHHYESHISMAFACDQTHVAQKDYLNYFNRHNVKANWLPLWPCVNLEPEIEKEYGAIFIGTLNKKLNPERVEFFEKLQAEVPILVQQADYRNFFPKAEIVVNQTVKGDLNFRVFESMMCGSMLLTEASNNGLLELFNDQEHLVTYKKNDYKDAAEKINYYLSNKLEAKKIAMAGRKEVLEKHSAMSRAKTILKSIANNSNRSLRNFGQVASMNWATRGFLKESSAYALNASKHSIRLINASLISGEKISEQLFYQLIFACLKHDLIFKESLGEQLLQRALEYYPENNLLKIALVWKKLNRGEHDNVKNSLAKMNLDASQKTLKLVNSAISEILTD